MHSWLPSVVRKAPFVRNHEQHQRSNATRVEWFSTNYPEQYLETDPSSGEWLRKQMPTKQSAVQYFRDSFPAAQWLLRYNLSWFLGDLVAGLTVGAVIIPQGMAYARLADLPVEMGLYSSFIGGVLYFMFGSSKDINIGPIAIASVVTNDICDEVLTIFPQEDRLEVAGLIALMAGAVIFLLAILRLGWLINLIALPAISAFVSGVALTITATQLSSLLGIRYEEQSDSAYRIYLDIFQRLGKTKVDAVVGISALILLYFIKWGTDRMTRRRPGQAKLWFFLSTIRTVFVILLFIFISFLVNRTRKDNPAFRVVGTVPKGFHTTFKPTLSRKLFYEILPNLPTLVIVLLIEHLSIAKSFGRMNNYNINPNSELLAIGVTNIIGPFIGSYAVSGSFSRTAINAKAGSRTPLAGVIAGILVVIAIYLLIPMLFFIPNSVLAAVIIHAIFDLITSPSTLYSFWRANPFDLMIWVIGLTVMLFTSVEIGLYVAIALSMAIHLVNILKTHGHLLGSVTIGPTTAGTDMSEKDNGQRGATRNLYLPLDRSDGCNPHLDVEAPPPGVFVFRLSDAFNFMNATRALEQLVDNIKQHTRPTEMTTVTRKGDQPWSVEPPRTEDAESAVKLRPILKAVILDFSVVNQIDATTVQALVDTRASLQRYAAPIKLQWRFSNIRNRWTRRALLSVGFGAPDFSAKTGEPEDFVPFHAFAQQSSLLEPTYRSVRKSWKADDVEANEKYAPSVKGNALSQATRVAHNDALLLETQEMLPIYGVNTPYFHPDIQSALMAVSVYHKFTSKAAETNSLSSATYHATQDS